MFAGKYNRMLELLWFIGYCREFPSQLADRICGHPDWNRHVKYAALKKGYISVYRVQYRQRVIRSLRLTPLGLEYIAQRDPKVLPYVMAQQDSGAGTRNVTERILRYHAQATALIMARNAGAVFLPDQKPSLLANPLASSAAYDPKQKYFFRRGLRVRRLPLCLQQYNQGGADLQRRKPPHRDRHCDDLVKKYGGNPG